MGLLSSDQIRGWNVSHKLQKRKLLIAINCIAATSIFFFGYDQGVMSGINNAKDYIETMEIGYVKADGTPEITNAVLQGGIVSVYYLGTLFGALFGGWAGGKVGRIRMIAAGAAWSILGVSLQCSAQNHNWMIYARIVNGFGTGILNAIVPVWATETAQHTSRGRFVSIQFSLNIFGIFVAYWLEYGLSFVQGGVTALRWRFPIAFQLVPLVVLLSVVWFFPESPRWLVNVGREEEAKYVLKRLRGVGTDPADEGRAEAEFEDIHNVVELEKKTTQGSSYLSMLTGRGSGNLHTGRRVRLVVLLQIMQKWVGITAVVIYQPTIFRLAGYSAAKSQLLSGINTITYMISTLICVFTLDRIGRRWALWWGSTAQGIIMFLLGCFIRLNVDAQNAGDAQKRAQYGAGAAFMVFMFTFVFGATWLTVPWAYQAEIFPLAVRSKGNAWGVVGWSIGSGWMVLLVPIMFAHIAEKTFYVFGAGNLLTIPIVWALYPESNQRTLEEMDLLFAADTPWNWDAERNYKKLAVDNQQILQVKRWSQVAADGESRLRPLSLVKLDLDPSIRSASTWEALWKWHPRSKAPSSRHSSRRRMPSEVSFTTFIDTEKSRCASAIGEDGTRQTEHVEDRPPLPPLPAMFQNRQQAPPINAEKMRLMKALQMRKKQQAQRNSMASDLDTPISGDTAVNQRDSWAETAPSLLEDHAGDVPSGPPETPRLTKSMRARKRQKVLAKAPNIGILAFEKEALSEGVPSKGGPSKGGPSRGRPSEGTSSEGGPSNETTSHPIGTYISESDISGDGTGNESEQEGTDAAEDDEPDSPKRMTRDK